MQKQPLAIQIPAMVWALALTVSFNAAWAQPLAEHVPADAIVYVGWRGADDPGEGYDGSNLKALRDATDLPSALSQMLDLIEQANPGDEEAAMAIGLIRTIGGASWRHPTAAYLQRVDDPDMPVRFVVLWKAEGVRGDELLAQLNQMIAQAPPDAPLRVGRSGDLVSLTIGAPGSPAEPVGEAPEAGTTLAENPDFKRTLAQVNPDGVLVVYTDGRGLISLIDMAAQMDGDPQGLEIWRKLRNALGLEGLNSAAWSAGFDGRDWRTDSFIDAPAPRTGLLAMLDGQPITDAELRAVPAQATWMLATRFDLGALLDSVRQVAQEIDPQVAQQIDAALAQGSAMTGVDLEADLIRGLGSAWLIYTDPGATGSGMLGFCLVNPLNDAQKVERALTSLQAIANAMMGQAGGNFGGGTGMRIRFHTTTDHGMTLHSLGIPFVSPTWSVHDGRLYVGLYPQTVLTAGDRARSGGSILDNEQYQALRARLGGGEATAIVFADLPRTAENSYQNLVMIAQVGSGILAMFGADPMPMLLPPYLRIEPYIHPAGQVAWSDDAGYHSRSISPFPGSMMLGPQGGTNVMMGAPMMAGILLPALGAARRTARGNQSFTNARQLLMSLHTYAADHDFTFPDDIAVPLSLGYVLDPAVYVSKASGKIAPLSFGELSDEQKAQWVRQNSSYILILTPKHDDAPHPSSRICLFERPEDAADPQKMIVGFLDGHVQSMFIWEARDLIEAQTGKTLEELIERQQNYQSPEQKPRAPAAP